MQSSKFNIQNCKVCQKPGRKVCSRCIVTRYCSEECQKVDWISGHSSSCFPFFIRQDQSGRKYAIASRDLKPGEIVLDEVPIFHVPQLFEHSPFLPLTQGTIYCVSCGLHMNYDQCIECTSCRIPVCSLDCENLPIHKENECKYFQEISKDLNGKDLDKQELFPRLVTAVRTMTIKEKNAMTWENLLKIGFGTPMKSQLQVVLNNVSGPDSIFPESKEAEVIEDSTKMMELILDKGYFIHTPNEYPKMFQSTRSGHYVYNQASSFEHSCSPNCTWRISNFPEFKIRIRVVSPVKQGQILTVSRFQYCEGLQKGNLDRLGLSKELFCFVNNCQCTRCVDPTEFGIFASSLICKNCPVINDNSRSESWHNSNAFAVPGNFNGDGFLSWRCTRCLKIFPASHYSEDIKKLQEELDSKSRNDPILMEKFWTDFIVKYRGNLLHPNHYLIQRAMEIVLELCYNSILRDSISCTADQGASLLTRINIFILCCKTFLEFQKDISPILYFESPVFEMLSQTVKCKLKVLSLFYHRAQKIVSNVESEFVQLIKILIALETEALEYFENDLPLGRKEAQSEIAEYYRKSIDTLNKSKEAELEAELEALTSQ